MVDEGLGALTDAEVMIDTETMVETITNPPEVAVPREVAEETFGDEEEIVAADEARIVGVAPVLPAQCRPSSLSQTTRLRRAA